MGKIVKALDKLLELDEILPDLKAEDPKVWINITLKYLEEADSEYEFYNEEVVDVHYITDKKLNYTGAFLLIKEHQNQNLIIDTYHSCIRVIGNRDARGQEFIRTIPNNLEEMVVMFLDNIACRAYKESTTK